MSSAPTVSIPKTLSPRSSSGVPFAIVTGDLVRTGGMDQANLKLAEYLSRHGHQVHAVAHRVDQKLAADPNVHFHRVAKPANAYLLGAPLLDRAGRKVGRRLMSSGGHVIVNGGNCKFGDVNWVHYVHAAYRPQSTLGFARRMKEKWSYRSFLASESRCLKMARVVVANSDLTRRHVIDRIGVPAERVHTVYYGTDPELFAPPTQYQREQARASLGWPANRPVVVFTGALGDRRKGFDVVFDAWKNLCGSESWDADLVVVGRGAELPAWEARAAAANMASRIRFLGFRKDVPEILRAADALVAPTRYEAYGLGVHESLCCGLPAFVSADAGVAERYPESLKLLLLSDPNDSADLAARLLGWRSDMHQCQKAVLVFADELRLRTWDDMSSDIERLAETAV